MLTRNIVKVMREQGLTTKQKLKLDEIIANKKGYELDDSITTFFAQYILDIEIKEDKSNYKDNGVIHG